MNKQESRCVASWLSDPADCWLREGCRYWDRDKKRCTYAEHKAGVAGAHPEKTGGPQR
jgi:hypothetical protein